MITQSELERERYESRLKAQRDAQALLDDIHDARENGISEGRERGLAEGHERGLAEGREQGRAEGQIARVQSLQRLLRRDLTTADELRKLPLADLERLADQLEAELLSRSNGS